MIFISSVINIGGDFRYFSNINRSNMEYVEFHLVITDCTNFNSDTLRKSSEADTECLKNVTIFFTLMHIASISGLANDCVATKL
ncbi:unnamed protein product, partial [Callosobruchus maculatus]